MIRVVEALAASTVALTLVAAAWVDKGAKRLKRTTQSSHHERSSLSAKRIGERSAAAARHIYVDMQIWSHRIIDACADAGHCPDMARSI